jgi:hypothetical protein
VLTWRRWSGQRGTSLGRACQLDGGPWTRSARARSVQPEEEMVTLEETACGDRVNLLSMPTGHENSLEMSVPGACAML